MILCDWRKAMPFPKPCEGQVSCTRLCHHGGHGSGRSLPVFADCCCSCLKFRASPYSGKVTNNPCICVCEGMVLSRLPQWVLTTLFLLRVLGSSLTAEGWRFRRPPCVFCCLACSRWVLLLCLLYSINLRVGPGTQKKLGGGGMIL